MLYTQIKLTYLCPIVRTILLNIEVQENAIKHDEPGNTILNLKSKILFVTFLIVS